MNNKFYTIASPDFPGLRDFDCWPLWCQWHDASELNELGLSDEQIEVEFLAPNGNGLEVYYPMVKDSLRQKREFLYAKASFLINESTEHTGIISLVQNEVVAATLFISSKEIEFYRNDRYVAQDENPKSIETYCRLAKAMPFNELQYKSPVTGDDDLPLNGTLRLY